jgi:CheY-like chemotaxis protein
VAQVRARWPDAGVCIVAVTADAFEDTREACLAAGFDGWLAKPFRIEELARVVEGAATAQAGSRRRRREQQQAAAAAAAAGRGEAGAG